jgi:serine/threonine protein kinase
MNNGDVIVFNSKKNFTYVKPLGGGGTGDTHLFLDETTGIQFAIKKYVPKDHRFIDDHYKRFVDEIIILFNISHPNIVRIYNYYLFPEAKTGYLQMEYVDGVSIDKFEPDGWGKDWNDIFSETIAAFEYLEQHGILHRDIRPANILIDRDENVKIIDFGFGKQLEGTKKDENSILLNWPATEMPNEVQLNQEYDERTEIYFVGVLFKHLLKEYMADFRFQHILEKMTKVNPSQRYTTFCEIVNDISAGVISEINFSDRQKEIYRNFANVLSSHINHYTVKYSPINNVAVTLSKLAELIRCSSLEYYIQDNSKLINCFINGGYNYSARKDVEVQTVVDFYGLITSLSPSKQKILFDNIYGRLSTIKVQLEEDELPF